LETLTNLKELSLWNNQIKEINGLESLANLQELNLRGNLLRGYERELIARDAQEIVSYCQEKAKKDKPGLLKRLFAY
jgi:Leucine-rich repeat (LRR) protein